MAHRGVRRAARPLRILLARLLAALLPAALLVGLPAPATADLLIDWVFEQRAAGMPTSPSPARTLAAADVRYRADADGSRVELTAALAAEPEPATDAVLRVELGERDASGQCEIRWSAATPILEPVPSATRDGATLHLDQPVSSDAATWDCGHVALVPRGDGADAAAYDRLDGVALGVVVADPAGYARIREVTGTRVPVGHWSPLRLRVETSTNVDAVWVRPLRTKSAAAVRVRTQRQPVLRPGRVTVRVWVRLRRPRPARLVLSAHPIGHLAFGHADVRTVRLTPRPASRRVGP